MSFSKFLKRYILSLQEPIFLRTHKTGILLLTFADFLLIALFLFFYVKREASTKAQMNLFQIKKSFV